MPITISFDPPHQCVYFSINSEYEFSRYSNQIDLLTIIRKFYNLILVPTMIITVRLRVFYSSFRLILHFFMQAKITERWTCSVFFFPFLSCNYPFILLLLLIFFRSSIFYNYIQHTIDWTNSKSVTNELGNLFHLERSYFYF